LPNWLLTGPTAAFAIEDGSRCPIAVLLVCEVLGFEQLRPPSLPSTRATPRMSRCRKNSDEYFGCTGGLSQMAGECGVVAQDAAKTCLAGFSVERVTASNRHG
ncbi:MAG TPA: hypothetical protein VIJ31_13760, partial [Acidothermaceae bacterium]